ncbi:hypothetical protein L218DRAFT_883998, partial [Marasmius fiardii PR-910]
NAASTGDAGEPWGIPFSMGFISPLFPSMYTAASLPERKLATHCTSSSGIPCRRSSHNSRLWLTKLK